MLGQLWEWTSPFNQVISMFIVIDLADLPSMGEVMMLDLLNAVKSCFHADHMLSEYGPWQLVT